MRQLFDMPVFGVLASIAAYEAGLKIYKKTKLPVLNPLLISIAIIIALLYGFNIGLDSYDKGGNMISFFLQPATVILAVPLYGKRELLKKHFLPIITGIAVGAITSIISILILARFFKLDSTLSLSLVPKSVTTPVGVELSKQIGGIPSITVTVIIITGITGAVLGPYVCKLFGITDRIAVGTALGTSAHAIGTTKAVELGDVEGAMSGMSIGIMALFTVILAPFLIKLI
jgi:predicted murein hydrolase (TIGR00659 family)